jgi:hypothetical protein
MLLNVEWTATAPRLANENCAAVPVTAQDRIHTLQFGSLVHDFPSQNMNRSTMQNIGVNFNFHNLLFIEC